jgi:hypothetical protein
MRTKGKEVFNANNNLTKQQPMNAEELRRFVELIQLLHKMEVKSQGGR